MPTKKRGTPRRAPKRKAKPRATTALVRQAPAPAPIVHATPVLEERRIQEGITLGELGLVEIKFTAEEEQILSEPPDPARIHIKPDRDGAIYLPHIDYTRLFNRAFGRGGWLLVPVGVPGLANKVVLCPYVLFIHGKPAALAQGEQEFFDSNRGQSYGDALESTVASGLRRCAKHLGVWLDLWDRDFADAWRAEHAIKVWVQGPKDDKPRPAWRKRDAAPLPYEQKGRGRQTDDYQAEEGPPAEERPRSSRASTEPSKHSASGERITDPQRRRLVMIGRNTGRDDQEVLGWLHRAYGYQSTADVKRQEYDKICRAIEADGPLPEGKATR